MKSSFFVPCGVYRQSLKRKSPKPVRSIRLRNCLGMIWSVSTLARSRGATSPRCTLNDFIAQPSSWLEFPVTDVSKVPRDRRPPPHHRPHQMSAPAAPLPSFKIAVAGGSTALTRLQNIGIHSQAHRASRLTPLEAGIQKNPMQAFLLCCSLHGLRSRHHHRPDFRIYAVALGDSCCRTQILNPRGCARSNKHAINSDVFDALSGFQRHVLQGEFSGTAFAVPHASRLRNATRNRRHHPRICPPGYEG